MDQDSLDLFVEKLIEEKNYPELDEEVIAQMKSDLKDRAEEHINGAILAAMPPEKLEEFDKVLDAADADEIQKFCSENIQDSDQVAAMALINFRNSYLGV